MKVISITLCICLFQAAAASYEEFGSRQGKLKPTQFLRSYNGFVNDFTRQKDAYQMEYHVGDSYRSERRNDEGEVSGIYAFVAPEGDEYEFKYAAHLDGYKVEGDALPKEVEETDDVKAAKKAFFEAYERQLELAGDYEYDESDESYESDESDEDDKYDDESSEESSEESDEDDSDESDEDEEDRPSSSNRILRTRPVVSGRPRSVAPVRTRPVATRRNKPTASARTKPTVGTSFFTLPTHS